MQVVTMEEKCVELVELLRSDQSRDTTSSQTIASYRQRAERIVDDDENLYRINFVSVLVFCISLVTHGGCIYRIRKRTG